MHFTTRTISNVHGLSAYITITIYTLQYIENTGDTLGRQRDFSPVFASVTSCVHTFGSGWMMLDIFKTITFIPHVGTSSSADDVCSSVDGFFLPSPMILVIFFPAPFPTVPVFCSDFVLFFPFPDGGRGRCCLIHECK